MQRAVRQWRLGMCIVLAAVAAMTVFGCEDDVLEEFVQPGILIKVTPDTATVYHREPSLSIDGTTILFTTDWDFEGGGGGSDESAERRLAVINVPPGDPWEDTIRPDLIEEAQFRPVVFIGNFPAESIGSSSFDPADKAQAEPVWHPSIADRFAFSIHNGNNLDRIYVCDLDLSVPDEAVVTSATLIGDPQGEAFYYNAPTFSPDGRWLLYSRYFFVRGAEGQPDQVEPQAIYAWDLTTDNQYQVTPGSSVESGAEWAPNGRSIVFHSNRGASAGSGPDIYTIAFDPDNPDAMPLAGSLRRLTVANSNAEGPSYLPEQSYGATFSPDGGSIVFVSTRRGVGTSYRDRSIWLMNGDGSDQRMLYFSRVDDIDPVFAPGNSRMVIFSSRNHPSEDWNGQRSDIWIVRDW